MKKMLLIMGVILSLVSTSSYASTKMSRTTRSASDIASISLALGLFEAEVGRLPTNEEGLQALIQCPKTVSPELWNGPYLRHGRVPIDPWKNAYIYRYPEPRAADGFGVYSLGPDRKSLTGGDDRDDCNNWNPDRPWQAYHRRYFALRAWRRRALLAAPVLAVVVPSVLLAYVLLRSRRRRRLTSA